MTKFSLPKFDNLSKKSASTIAIRGIGVILTYLVTLFITNNFSENLVGKWNYANSMLFIIGSICLFGANQSIYQLGGKFSAEENTVGLKYLYRKYIVISTLIFLVVVLTLLFLPDYFFKYFSQSEDLSHFFIKIGCFSFFYFLATFNFEVLRLLEVLKTSEFFRSIFRTGLFAIGILLIFFLDREEYIVDVFLVSFLLTAVITTGIIYRKFIVQAISVSKSTQFVKTRDIIKVSLPMSLSAILMLGMQSVDSFFIVKYASFEKLAFYSIAMKITVLISIVLTSIGTIIAPEISRHYFSGNINLLKNTIFRSSQLNFILTAPIILIILFFPSWILNFFGENYVEATDAFLILAVGQLVSTFCGSVGLYLNMTQKQNYFLILLIFALLLNTLFNFLLVPTHGIRGAAIASTVSLVFWNILGVILIYKKDKVVTFFRLNEPT